MRIRLIGQTELEAELPRAGLKLSDSDSEGVIIGAKSDVGVMDVAALQKPVLLEVWPEGWQPGDFKALSEAAQQPVIPGFLARWDPRSLAVKTNIEKLGEPGLIRIHRWESTSSVDSVQRLVVDVDLLMWLLDSHPETVYASQPAALASLTQLHFGFPNGQMALIDFCSSIPMASDYYSLSVIGSRGAAYSDDHHNQQLVFRDATDSVAKTANIRQRNGKLLCDFAAALRGSDAVSVNTLISALTVIEQASASLETSEAVALTP